MHVASAFRLKALVDKLSHLDKPGKERELLVELERETREGEKAIDIAKRHGKTDIERFLKKKIEKINQKINDQLRDEEFQKEKQERLREQENKKVERLKKNMEKEERKKEREREAMERKMMSLEDKVETHYPDKIRACALKIMKRASTSKVTYLMIILSFE